MEDESDDHEEAKEENLNAEAANDDILALLYIVFSFGCREQTTSCMVNSQYSSLSAYIEENKPALWARKDSTSPVTNTLVNHRGLMIDK